MFPHNGNDMILLSLFYFGCASTYEAEYEYTPPEYRQDQCSNPSLPVPEEYTANTEQVEDNPNSCIVGKYFTISDNEILDGWEYSPAQMIASINEYNVCNWEEKPGFIQPYITIENPEIHVRGQERSQTPNSCYFHTYFSTKISFYDENGDCISEHRASVYLEKGSLRINDLYCDQIIVSPAFTSPIEYGCFGSFSAYLDESQEHVERAYLQLREEYKDFELVWNATCTQE